MPELLQDLAEIARRGLKYYRIFCWAPAQQRRFCRFSLERQLAAQREPLLALIRHAARNAPFYRDTYAALGLDAARLQTLPDIRQLPLTTKDDLRRNFPDRLVVLDGSRPHPADYGRSSGSTGEAVQFLRQNSWKRSSYFSLLSFRQGLLSPRAAFLMSPQCSATSCSLTDQRETFEDRLRDALVWSRLNSYFHLPSSLDIFRETEGYFERLLRQLRQRRTELIVGAPNYWGQLARYLLATGQRLPVRAAICYSELLLASVRQEISQAFECPVYNHYGAGETPGIADECVAGRWHLRVDVNYLEVVDEQGQVCPPGRLGRLLVTPLDNYRMPLIRYEVGDLATLASGPCPCGRQNPALERIEGRTSDAWRGSAGQWVAPAAVGDAACRAGLRGRYRVIQQALDAVDLEWVADDLPAEAEAIAERLGQELGDLLGVPPLVDLRPVRYIPPEKSNKYRLIFSRLTTGTARRKESPAATESCT